MMNRPDAGRDIGTEDLRCALLTLAERHGFPGGVWWRRERLRSRLTRINPSGELVGLELLTLIEMFNTVRDSLVLEHVLGGDVLDDITGLLAAGDKSLVETAMPECDLEVTSERWQWAELFSDSQLCELVRQRRWRALQAYREIVETSFGATARILPLRYQAMPVRHQVTLVRRRSVINPVVEYPRLYPVASWADACVTVETADTAPPSIAIADVVSCRAELARLGREAHRLSMTDWSVVHRDGPDQSEVLRLVSAWLKADIEQLLPSIRRNPLSATLPPTK